MRVQPRLGRFLLLLLMMARVGQGLVSSAGKPVYSVSSSSTSTSMSANMFIHWFRLGDLRLHDNPALHSCLELAKQKQSASVLPLVCLDPRVFGDGARSSFGSLKCGPLRAKFILESVSDLRLQLEKRGGGLLVAHGKPEDVLERLVSTTGSTTIPHVTCQEEVCSEELRVDKKVRSMLRRHNPQAQLHTTWGSTLYSLSDLPFKDNAFGIPDTFTPFRNKVEKNCEIHAPLSPPLQMKLDDSWKNKQLGPSCGLDYMPTLQELGYTEEQVEEATTLDPRGVMAFQGGETAALQRVNDYIWEKDLLKVYFDTRNGMLGADYSTKFAPWLAHGCVSPRYIAQQCRKYEQARVANKSTYWVVFELLWRDFFKFFALKHGNAIFFREGTVGSDKKWGYDARHVRAWKEGRTGYPLVDANMRELAATGFMSNRGRQNVCSFLAIDMNQDWRYGADYFESVLLDYDVHSNWGNWCAGAGMTGGRLNRFNIVKQSKDYDCHGEYVKHWLPELKDLPTELIHEPWKMTQFQQMEYGVRLGVDYPNPIIAPFLPRSSGGKRGGRGGGKKDNHNHNRGRGQRKDMKSLKEGTFRIN